MNSQIELTTDEKEIVRIAEKIDYQAKLMKIVLFVANNYIMVKFILNIGVLGLCYFLFGRSPVFVWILVFAVYAVDGLLGAFREYAAWNVIKKLSLKIKSLEKAGG